jgi:hypothetical protein
MILSIDHRNLGLWTRVKQSGEAWDPPTNS